MNNELEDIDNEKKVKESMLDGFIDSVVNRKIFQN